MYQRRVHHHKFTERRAGIDTEGEEEKRQSHLPSSFTAVLSARVGWHFSSTDCRGHVRINGINAYAFASDMAGVKIGSLIDSEAWAYRLVQPKALRPRQVRHWAALRPDSRGISYPSLRKDRRSRSPRRLLQRLKNHLRQTAGVLDALSTTPEVQALVQADPHLPQKPIVAV